MLDAPAMVAARIRAQGVGIGIQRQAIAAVADRVGRHLHAATLRLRAGIGQLLRGHHQQATIAMVVAVVLQHRRATAA